jgi:hypothetical protein
MDPRVPSMGILPMTSGTDNAPVSTCSSDPSPRPALESASASAGRSLEENEDDLSSEDHPEHHNDDLSDADSHDLGPVEGTTRTPPSSLNPGDETPTSSRLPEQALAVAEEEPAFPSRSSLVCRASNSGSISSELSSSSAATADDQRHGDGSGRASPSSMKGEEVPPAPPSTPASHPSLSFSFDGISDHICAPSLATPIAPLLRQGSYMQNTTRLEEEQQRRILEEAMTPAPCKAAFAYSEPTPRPMSDAAGAATPKPGHGLSGPTSLPPDDFSDWAVGDRYDLVRILGRGSYGEVAQAADLYRSRGKDVVYVAIKRIQSPFDQQVDAIRLYREIHILRRMREGGESSHARSNNPPRGASRHHDCIIQLLDVIPPPTDDLDDFHDLYLVFECTFLP